MNRLTRLALVTILLALLASLALNVALFAQARRYYLELNETRLDPLGLDTFSTELPRTDKPLVVFFGDSRAADWPPPQLDRFEFANRGIGAQTSTQTLLRFDAHVAPLLPDVVIVQVGINDLKTVALFPGQRQAIVEACLDNIRQIVERSTNLGAKVILTTVFPVDDVPLECRLFWSNDVAAAVGEVNAALRALDSPGVLVFDAHAILVDHDTGLIQTRYAEDELHLNVAGYTALNAELRHVLNAVP